MGNKALFLLAISTIVIHGQFNNHDDAIKKLRDAARETFWKPNQSLLLQKLDTSKLDQFMSDLNNYLDKNGHDNITMRQVMKLINDSYLNLVAGLKSFSGRMTKDRILIEPSDEENDRKAYKLILNFKVSVQALLENARDLLVDANKSLWTLVESKEPTLARNLLLEVINILNAATTKALDEFKTFPGDMKELPTVAHLRWKKLYGGLYATPPIGGKDINFGQLVTVIGKPFPF